MSTDIMRVKSCENSSPLPTLVFVLYQGLENRFLSLSAHEVQQDLEYQRTKEQATGHKLSVCKSKLSCSHRRQGKREGERQGTEY